MRKRIDGGRRENDGEERRRGVFGKPEEMFKFVFVCEREREKKWLGK